MSLFSNARRIVVAAVLLLVVSIPALGDPLLHGAKQVAVGDGHACAVILDGTVGCWGANWYDQLGDGTSAPDRAAPVPVISPTDPSSRLSNIVSVGAGHYYSCALASVGNVYCWGSAGPYGALGNGSTFFETSVPMRVWIAEPVREIAVGYGHACALLDNVDHSIKCWGQNSSGQLGDGTLNNRSAPVDVVITEKDGTHKLLEGVRHIAAGSSHTCAVLDDGSAACWGSGVNGERGDGTFTAAQTSPVTVLSSDGKSLLTDISQISAGGNTLVGGSHTCVRFASTWLVSCWGSNSDGELGSATASTRSALPLPVSAGVLQISAGYRYSCAVLADHRASCWGNGNLGELGAGTATTYSNTPIVLSLPPITDISAGNIETCAVMADTGIKCWGSGLLGNGVDSDVTSFSAVDVVAGAL